jgi:TonB-linked SusC/RagA family outer membrane protein
LVLATVCGVVEARAQQRQITGRVTSAAGEALTGVAVSVMGTAFETVTHDNGLYSIAAPNQGVTLLLRRIGYKRKEVPVAADQATADVQLEQDIFNLEAVVVTGQATGIERRNAAIAATNVTGSQVTGVPAPTVDRALQGKVPGAIISQNSGAPGGGTQIQIRGSNTVVANSDPLYVVDGVIYSNASLSTGLFTVTASGNPQSTRNDGEKQDDPVNRLSDLNPNDIESIQVLRDAAATSMYGSKGVNGVVIITTNRGQSGKPRANIIQRLGVSSLLRAPATRPFDTTTAFDVFGDSALVRSYEVNGKLPTFDHARELAGNKPLSYETQLDLTGGGPSTRYFLSGNLKGDGGIIRNTGFQRQTLRANIDQGFSDRLNVSLSTAFNRTTTQRGFTNNDNRGASVTYGIAYIPGFVPLEPVNGVYPQPGITYLGANPLQTTALGVNDEAAVRFTGGLTATYQALQRIHHNLQFRAAGGMDFFNQHNQVFAPPELYFQQVQSQPGVSTLGNADSRFLNWNLNAIHTYTPGTGWRIVTSAGIQWEDRELERSRVTARGLLPGQENVNQGASVAVFQETTHERTFALYGREDWLGMNERLNLAASVRGERTSANGDPNKYYFYPSATGSYRFPDLLGSGSDVKLRLAYGVTGNQPVFGQKFTTLQGGASIGGNVGTVVGATAGDPTIRPERTKEIAGGIDATFLNDRASIEVSVFHRRTSDLMVPVTPAQSTGFSTEFINGGELQNEGLEIGGGIALVRKPGADLFFHTTFTSDRNKVLSLDLPGVSGGACPSRALQYGDTIPTQCPGFRPGNAGYGLSYGEFFVQVNQPITMIIGVDDQGRRIFLGQANPKFRWTFSLDGSYRRLSASALFEWQDGGVAENQTLSLYDCNNLAPDGNTAAGQARYNACINTGDARPFVQSTSFGKLREVSLALDLPDALASRFGAKSARVTLTGRNLLLITKYFGYDPEVSNYGSQSITRNIDLGPYPPARQFFFTIQAGF